MKRITFTLCILFFALLTIGQPLKYENKEIALITFNYNIDKDFKLSLDTQADLFPDVDNRKADKIIALLKERTWYLLEARLKSELRMYILPINSYGKVFKYDEYNFPNLNINQALKRGTSKYYLKVDLTLSSPITKKEAGYGAKDSIANKIEKMDNACLPSITISITTYNDKGIIPVQKISGTAKALIPWPLSEDIFNGLVNIKQYNKDSTDNLLGLTNVAIGKLIYNFK